jgi:hypothetical protein
MCIMGPSHKTGLLKAFLDRITGRDAIFPRIRMHIHINWGRADSVSLLTLKHLRKIASEANLLALRPEPQYID